MPEQLRNAVAVITGASRGIGRAAARGFAANGARLALCSRGPGLREVAAEIRESGAEVLEALCDVSDPSQVRAFVQKAVERFGRIDVLLNNAGLSGPGVALVEYPPAEWRRVLGANLDGPFHFLQAVLDLAMLRQRSGSIINISSGAGRFGHARQGAYAVGKFGLEGLTQVAAEELKEFGIRVNALNPGPTRTSLRAAFAPAEDPASVKPPEQVLPALVYLASSASAGITGVSFDLHPQTGELVPVRAPSPKT